MDETFFILSFIAVSFEIHKTYYQNKFRSKLFLPTKFTFTKTIFLPHKMPGKESKNKSIPVNN